MKLIVCKKCVDVKLLTQTTQYCHCTKSGGNYNEDGDTITIFGPCKVYGVDNRVFAGYIDRGNVWLYDERNGKVTRVDMKG